MTHRSLISMMIKQTDKTNDTIGLFSISHDSTQNNKLQVLLICFHTEQFRLHAVDAYFIINK